MNRRSFTTLNVGLFLFLILTVTTPARSFTSADAGEPAVRSRLVSRITDVSAYLGFERSIELGEMMLVPPTISSISPSTPQTSVTDQIVRVNGTNFASGLTVTVTFPGGGTGLLSGSQIQNRTSTSFNALVTLNGAGQYCFRVNNTNGESSNNFCFNVATAQTPTITSISPSTPTASNSDQNVTVNGTNFQNGMTVTIFFPGGGSGTLSGSQLTNVTPTQFTMVVTLNLSGQYGIRINNPSGLMSGIFNFTVRPGITSVSPSSPCVRGVDQSVTVNGAGFQSGLTVTVFFPTGGSTTLSGSQIQSVTPTSFVMVATLNIQGQYGIRVNNPNGTQSTTFNFSTQFCVTISSIDPASPLVSNNNQNVQVNGSGFVSGLSVTVFFPGGGNTTLTGSQIQNVTSNSFTMVVTLNVLGQYGIRVTNPNGNWSNTFTFNTQNPGPTVTSVVPSSPCVRTVDQNVTVNGTNFQAGLTVTLFFPGGGSATLSGAQIQAVTPTSFTLVATLNLIGTYGLRVNNPGGAQSNTFQFPTQHCVTITSVNPASPPVSNSDQNVVVNGSGFVSGLSVTVFFPGGGSGTLSGAQIQNVTPTSFTMVATLNVLGQYGIRVNNPNGDQSNTFNFSTTTGPAPTVTSVQSPLLASPVDQNVNVTGTNFVAGLTVTLTFPGGGTGILSGTQIQNVTPTSFTMRVTLGGAGAWSMRVNNPSGAQSSPFGFTVQSNVQAPVIHSINPTVPTARATDQDVIVTGSNFKPGLTVPITFPGGGGTELSGLQIQNVTSTSFVMRATLNAAGSWTIRVKNPDTGESTPFPFSVGNGTSPVINSINPSTPSAGGADQNVTVNGGNFQAGLIVYATFPGGGMATLQGTGQIQNVTSGSFTLRITLNAPGGWTIRVVNPNGSQSQQFAFNVSSGPPPTGLPTSVLSPVIGPLRVTTTNQGTNDGKWEFNQHGTGYHTPTGGVSLTNDTKAWDVNLYTPTSGNADAGKAVFATASGQVVSFVGTAPGAGPGAVLIAHPNAASPTWYSGYLHMTNVRVTVGAMVDQSTLLGDIGRTGANNDHLHFAVYSGANTRGNLRSFDVQISERSPAGPNQPSISGINPSTVNQGNNPTITISGANFDASSMLEVKAPNGQSFQILPASVSAAGSAAITNITAGSITALVPFTLSDTYEFSVVNRATNLTSGDCTTANCRVYSAPTGQRTPVILIPGVLGSRIANRTTGQSLWLGNFWNRRANQEQLRFDVEDPSSYREIAQRPVVATEIIRSLDVEGEAIGITNVYGPLIDHLTSPHPGPGYTLYTVQNPALTSPQCPAQPQADLFLFPYDWRNSNVTSAQDLARLIQCIRTMRGNPPNFKVDIIAHSMGGLVARRYILTNPGAHYVDRVLTLGTPWLGAPKILNVMETGNYDFIMNRVIASETLKSIAPYLRGPHELIPSRAYTDEQVAAGERPLWEDGWNNFDYDSSTSTPASAFNFDRLKATTNYRYPEQPLARTNPGNTTEMFHSFAGQDNWAQRNSTGVTYYHFYGVCKKSLIGQIINCNENNTVRSVVAKRRLWVDYYIDTIETNGDGTVPKVSATRQGLRPDHVGSEVRRTIPFRTDHSGLAKDSFMLPAITCVVREPDPNNCLPANSSELGADVPNYRLKMIGSPEVIVTDSFGNTANPLSSSVSEGVPTISTDVFGEAALAIEFPVDQPYKVTLISRSRPISLSVIHNNGETDDSAVRYVDISLPADVWALIQISPGGVSTLSYDSNGDGTFDTPVTPTIIVNGPNAADLEAPSVNVNETVQGGSSRIDLEATDAGSGVQRIMYSLNGTSFQQYSTPLQLNAATTPTIYVYADDNVFNRSGLVTHNLTATSSGFSVAGPATSVPGGQAMASWNAPGGRPVDDWIGLYQINGLNSAYLGKQYTGGATTGSLAFTLPNQAGIYQFRYLLNDGLTSVAASAPINVTAGRPPIFDFDGDDKTDIGIFRPADGTWWINRSSNGSTFALQFGLNTDGIVPADFTGDGKTDIAVWRPSTGEWFVLRSEDSSFFSFPFGTNGDVPVPADYDGDGRADPAVFRASNGTWYIQRSGDNGVTIQQFGAGADRPVPADYDGDGKADIAIFRPSDGTWWLNRSTAGVVVAQFGNATDKQAPGDYTGDGKADIAFWRPATGDWFILRSEDFSFYAGPFGTNGDVPAPGDYDGDGRFDTTVFRPSNGIWYSQRSTGGVTIQQFGATGDRPVANAFVP